MLNENLLIQFVKPKQVWYANFPFEEDRTQAKDRPVLILDVNKEKVLILAMKITSTKPRNLVDFVLEDWSDIPLDHESTICPTQVRTIPITRLRRLAGHISEQDWQKAVARFMAYRQSKQ